ncbi:MAG: hypothetical protein AAB467_04495, partial [Patescibacteria group bacterium]
MVPNSKFESAVLPSKTGGTVLSPPHLPASPAAKNPPRQFAGRRRVYQTGKPAMPHNRQSDRPERTAIYKNSKDPAPGFGPITLPDGKHKVRVAVIGGLEEIGRNCTLVEYGNDIILIDLGLQFPEEDMPGIDYIIPNMAYLKGKEKNI